MLDNSLFYLYPHPRQLLHALPYLLRPCGRSLLPGGEGITSIIDLRDFMSSIRLVFTESYTYRVL